MGVGINLVDFLLVVFDILQLLLPGQSHLSYQLLFPDPPHFLLVWPTALHALIHRSVDCLLRHHLGSLVGRPGLEGVCGLLHCLKHGVADDVAVAPVIPACFEPDNLVSAHLDRHGAVSRLLSLQ